MIYFNYIPPRATMLFSLSLSLSLSLSHTAINYQVLDFLIERSAAPKFREFTHGDGEDVCMREYVRAIGKGPYNPPQNYPSSERARARARVISHARDRFGRLISQPASIVGRSRAIARDRGTALIAGESGTDRSPITRLLSAETISSTAERTISPALAHRRDPTPV